MKGLEVAEHSSNWLTLEQCPRSQEGCDYKGRSQVLLPSTHRAGLTRVHLLTQRRTIHADEGASRTLHMSKDVY
eukprot:34188-Eustigmatos_ZCMA.PRE.1